MLLNRLLPVREVPSVPSAQIGFTGIIWSIFVLVLGIVCLDRLNAHFGWWMDQAHVCADARGISEPGVWLLRTSKPVPWHRVSPLQIRLRTAASTPFIYAPRPERVTDEATLFFSCDKKGNVQLSSCWQFNPFFRAGPVSLRFPATLPRPVSTGMQALLVAIAAFLLIVHARQGQSTGFWPRLRVGVHALVSMAGRHSLFFFCLPSLYFLAVYPPLWKDVDALTQLIYGVSVTNVFHFPALFCSLARLPMWLGTLIERPSVFSPFSQQQPSLLGIYSLVVFQHAFLIVALREFLVASCSTNFWRGIGLITVLLAPCLYAQAQLCGSESWSLIATIFLFASGLRIMRRRSPLWRAWVTYGLALVFAIGSRHINVLLGVWLAGVCLLLAVTSLRRDRRASGYWLVQMGMAGATLLLAIILNRELANGFGRYYGIEPRSTLGRTLSDRIKTFLEQLSPKERVELADRLMAQTPDPDVRAAVRIQAVTGCFYNGGAQALTDFICREGLSGESAAAECDRAELRAMLLYLRTMHPKLLEVIRKDVKKGFTSASNRNLAVSAFGGNFFAAIYAAKDPGAWESLAALKSARFPAAAVWLDVALGDPYLGFTRRVSVAWLIAILLVSWLAALAGRKARFEEILPWCGMACAGAIVFIATCICVYYMDRYALPLFTTVWLALAPSWELACRRAQRTGSGELT